MSADMWNIVGNTMARRTYQGRVVVLTLGRSHRTIEQTIMEWEQRERQRLISDLSALGDLVDTALNRLLSSGPRPGQAGGRDRFRRTGPRR
ncbi:hypothetical protein [Nonomuraea endophytica]|uniref:Uncharacterized protein n=1 Tax=Nonomuraea endophytica TaxID=714136 RepID=A0A7W8EL21_9ACTN|nr:hypothetical protein [Nonomuraea endophytica]MBB5084850.1 hypothetical protein [Nonomuraea endophytica]